VVAVLLGIIVVLEAEWTSGVASAMPVKPGFSVKVLVSIVIVAIVVAP
jgi:hypothetical protein